jgi:hypothetical protein
VVDAVVVAVRGDVAYLREQRRPHGVRGDGEKGRKRPGDLVDPDQRRRDEESEDDGVHPVERVPLEPARPAVFGVPVELLEVVFRGQGRTGVDERDGDEGTDHQREGVAHEQGGDLVPQNEEDDLEDGPGDLFDGSDPARAGDFLLAVERVPDGVEDAVGEQHERDQQGDVSPDVGVDPRAKEDDEQRGDEDRQQVRDDACGEVLALVFPLAETLGECLLEAGERDVEPDDKREPQRVGPHAVGPEDPGDGQRGHEPRHRERELGEEM